MAYRWCSVCEWRRVYAKDRCRSCYMYRRKHKQDKDLAYLIREGERWYRGT